MSAFEQYKTFISTLFKPEDTICFVAIEHNKDRSKENVINRFASVTEALTPEFFQVLNAVNDKKNSVYVGMNTFPASLVGSRTGRTQENVVAVRALYADVDNNGKATIDKMGSSTEVPSPSIVLESSPGKFQGMWPVDGISKEDAKPLLKAMAQDFDTDSAVAETARVLRVPGFKNHKYADAPEVKVVQMTSKRYTRDDFKIAVKPKEFEKKPEGWLDAPFIHKGGPYGGIDNQLCSFIGHYITAKNINDPDVLYNIMVGHIEKNGCFEKDGTTEYPCKMERVKELCHLKVKEWKTGEEKFGKKLEFNQTATPAVAAAPVGWGAIVPLNDSLPPVPAFNTSWLPESIRPWVVDVAERMNVPVDFTAICALCALAGVTGRRAFVYPLANDKEWKESICIPGAVVAASGRKKTPTWKAFMNALEEIEAEWTQEYNTRMAQYKEDHKKWKAEKIKAEKSKEARDFDTPEPRKPRDRHRLLINDATYEVIQNIMTTNPQGVLYFRDELSGLVDELDREGREGQRQFFLSMMNGNDRMTVDRITRDGGSAILCGTVFGSFQPDLLRSFLFDSKSIADGTVPRFHMIVWPDDIAGKKTDRVADKAAKEMYRNIVRRLAPIEPETITLHFDAEAQKLFYDFRDVLEQVIKGEKNLGKQSHLSKYEGALAKIAALFQLVDLVATAKLEPVSTVNLGDGTTKTNMVAVGIHGQHVIDVKHLKMAIEFLGYLQKHMHRVYDSQRDPVSQAMSVIIEKLSKGELRDGFTARDIQRKRWLNHAQTIEFALEELAEKNWVRQQPKPVGPGQHATRWEINPEVRN